MSELTTKRTLVKSPPELWAEVSDLEALAKHLGEFGEIKITRLEPETTVVWEGDRISGTVQLEPSGWGTKVTLTAELAAIEEPEAPEAPVVEEPVAVEGLVIEEKVVEEPAVVAEPVIEEETVEAPVAVEPPPPSMPEEPRRGFWSRLFKRRVAEVPPPQEPDPTPIEEPEPEPAPVEEPPAPEPPPLQPVPDPDPPREPEPEDPLPAAQLDDDRAVAVLTEVLDNLGSAHHRPFSRS
jgi:hypothetical protein